jgi:hypothetical protein
MKENEVFRESCTYGERSTSRVLVGKPQETIQLEKTNCRWDGSIIIDLHETGWGKNWTDLSLDRIGGVLL